MNKRLHVFVLIDALGWSVLEGREFLQDLLPFRRPLRTVLGFSSGAIPTILTGVPPEQNGHWNLFYYDPKGSPFRWLRYFAWLPDRLLNHRVTRRLLKEVGRRVLGLGPSFECSVSPRFLPWFNWVEKRNLYDAGGTIGAPSIFDRLKEHNVEYRVYSYHHATDAEIVRQAERDIQGRAAEFFFIYLSEMDLFLHNNFGDTPKVEEKLAWYEKKLRRLFEISKGVDAERTFTVFSDHGMTLVENHFDLVAHIRQLGLTMPDDYLAVYDSTMARFWFFNSPAREKMLDMLRLLPCGRVLPDEELRALGIFFPDRRFGEIVFLLDPGWLISASDFNGKGWMPVGMHGYHPDDAYSDGVFLSNHEPPLAVENVADVYYCMRQATDSEAALCESVPE
jgi:hypothetical protein